MRTKNQGLRTKIAALKAIGMPQVQIAATTGVSEQTVCHIAQEIRADLEPALKDYRIFSLRKKPLEDRLDRYCGLIDQNEQPMVALKALERLDYITFGAMGENEQVKQQPQPLFSLPVGSRIAIQVGPVEKPVEKS